MHRRSWVAALLALPVAALRMLAQTPVSASGDTVILIVKSPRGQEVTFSGSIVLRDAKTTRRFDNVKTPFEIRLPVQDIDARFVADDGAALDGEIVAFRNGKKGRHAWGTVYRGPLVLYHEPGKGFGFGDRRALPGRAVP
jgi:hypothetical protein